MHTTEPARVELRTQLAHPVFVDHLAGPNPQMPLEPRIQLRLRNLPPAAFETTRLQRETPRRRDHAPFTHPLKQVYECQRRAEQPHRLPERRQHPLAVQAPIFIAHKFPRIRRRPAPEHTRQRRLRRIPRRLREENRPSLRHPKPPPARQRRRVVEPCGVKVMRASRFARRPAREERRRRLLRRKARDTKRLKHRLRHRRNLPPRTRLWKTRAPLCQRQIPPPLKPMHFQRQRIELRL